MAIRTRLSISATPGRPYAAWVAKAEAVAVAAVRIYKVAAEILNSYSVAVELNELNVAIAESNDLSVAVEVL